MRRFSCGLAVIGAGLLASLACAPAAPVSGPAQAPAPSAAAPAPAAPQASQAPQPKRGGVTVHLRRAAGPNLHPLQGGGADQRGTVGPAYESLLTYQLFEDRDLEADFEVIPWLAAAWDQPDPTTYLFRLAKGVRWHDGVEFTAADVVFSYQYLSDKANSFSKGATIRKDMATIEALDPQTVRVTTRQASPYFLRSVADDDVVIVPKHVAEAGGDFAKTVVGTGPFKMKSADLKKENVFERFEGYWQPGRPYMEGVRLVYGPDDSAMEAALVAGKADSLTYQRRAQLDAILGIYPKARYQAQAPTYGNVLYPNLERPPFNDIRVRKALHLGLDRQAMQKQLTAGQGVINPPGVPATKKGWAIPAEELANLPGYRQPKAEDLAEAKRLLAEAGYAGGLKTTVIYPTTVSTPSIAEAFAGQMRTIGVDMELKVLPVPEFRELETRGGYDVIFDLTYDMDESGKVHSYYHSKGALNKIGLKDAKVDAALDTVLSSMDAAERKKALLDFQYALLAGYYVIPTIEHATYQLYQPWYYSPDGVTSLGYYLDTKTATRAWIDTDLLPADRR